MSEIQQKATEIAKFYNRNDDPHDATNLSFANGDGVINGPDDRKDYFNLDDNIPRESLHKKLVDSTVILTKKDNLIEQADGSFKLGVEPFTRGSRPPCNGERFGNQHTGGWCSGFMMGKDIIVTAGHCGKTNADIKNTAYVFGFMVTSEGEPGTTEFRADQVYFGKELVAHDLSPSGDFAIVRVDRAITTRGAKAFEIRRNGSLGLGEHLGVIGYPSGLPVKVAFGDTTTLIRNDGPWMMSNLDTYGGNSGSAVFNKDGQVEGILVRGTTDYIQDDADFCFHSNRVNEPTGSEAVTKASVFVSYLPDIDQ